MEVWNYANLWESVAAATPENPALIHSSRVVSWRLALEALAVKRP